MAMHDRNELIPTTKTTIKVQIYIFDGIQVYLSLSSNFIFNWRSVSSPIQSSLCFPVGGVNNNPTSFCNYQILCNRQKDVKLKALNTRESSKY